MRAHPCRLSNSTVDRYCNNTTHSDKTLLYMGRWIPSWKRRKFIVAEQITQSSSPKTSKNMTHNNKQYRYLLQRPKPTSIHPRRPPGNNPRNVSLTPQHAAQANIALCTQLHTHTLYTYRLNLKHKTKRNSPTTPELVFWFGQIASLETPHVSLDAQGA